MGRKNTEPTNRAAENPQPDDPAVRGSSEGELASLIDLFVELADASPEDCEQHLTALSEHRPEVAAALRRLLQAESSSQARLLDDSVLDVAAAFENPDTQIHAMPQTAPNVGSKYEVLAPLGFGNHGDVYLARQVQPISRDVAIKVLRPHQVRPSTIERMAREAKALAALDHPNIATVLEAGQTEDGRPFIVTEHVPGEPIDRWCASTRASVETCCQTISLVCRAVEHMHQRGIIHRDLKPTNILVTGPVDSPVPKILDLGIAKILGDNGEAMVTITREGALLGSLGFIAPEQFHGAPADTRADIFAIGRIVERLLSAESSHPPVVNKDVQAIIRQATDKNPQQRYQSAGVMASDLEAVLAGQPVTARRQTPAESVSRLVRRNKGASAIALTSMIAVIIAVGVAIERSTAHAGTLREQAQTLAMQKVLLTKTLDGTVVVLGRYSGTITERAELAQQIETQLEATLALSPADRDLRVLLARAWTEQAQIALAMGEPHRALVLATRASDTMRREVDPATADVRTIRQLGLAVIVRGDCLHSLREAPSAREEYRWALDLHRGALSRFPQHIGLMDDLSWSLDRFSQPLRVPLPDGESARAPFAASARKRLALAEEMLELDESRFLSRFNLAVAHLKLGRIYAGLEDLVAENYMHSAREALEALCLEDPGRTALHLYLASTWSVLSEIHDRRDEDKPALDALALSIDALFDAVGSQPQTDATLAAHLRARAIYLAEQYARYGREIDSNELLKRVELVVPER